MKTCALFSGGKDSTHAIHESSHTVDVLLTLHPKEDSMMYHSPATELTALAAESMDKEHVSVEAEDEDELAPLHDALASIDADTLVTGAIESEYQKTRIEGVCDELGMECESPLWKTDPSTTLNEIVDTYTVILTGVAADGLDRSWLGRTLDNDAVKELRRLHESRGVHPLGEGGEYESLVVDGPHMNQGLEVEYEVEWDGVRGNIRVTDARLE